MSTQANSIPGSGADARRLAPAAIPAARLMCWSVQREVWENRSLYLAPLAAGALAVVGALAGAAHLPDRLRAAGLDPARQREIIEQPYTFAALLIMASTFVVAIFYSLEAMQGERRDRSILFWKSLPVPDTITVLAKASIPIVLLPLITFAVTLATQWVMLMIGSARLMASGMSAGMLWGQLPVFQMSVVLLYHLVAIHGFWYAPFYAWLFMVSAWARRVPILWAVLPPLALGVVEKIAFNTSHFGEMLRNRMYGGSGDEFAGGRMAADPLMHLHPGSMLMSPGLWAGLALSAVFLAAAVRLRRYRGPN